MADKVRNFSATLYRFARLSWLLLFVAGSVSADDFALHANPLLSHDGVFQLSWITPASAQVQIQRDNSADFASASLVYRGTDNASVITGLTDGRYFFRGRLQLADGNVSAWSEPLVVTVEHHSLQRALSFFALGAVVFVATLFLIVSGARRHGLTK